MKRIRIRHWPLAMKKRPLESRFRQRAKTYGHLMVIPVGDMVRLIERAQMTSRQLELPLDLREDRTDGR